MTLLAPVEFWNAFKYLAVKAARKCEEKASIAVRHRKCREIAAWLEIYVDDDTEDLKSRIS